MQKLNRILIQNGCKNTLKKAQNKEDSLHSFFSGILKKTEEADSSKMENAFKEYIEHLYSIINFLNLDLFK